MELKQYWYIVWQKIWIPLLLLVVAGGASWLTYQEPPPTYSTTMRFTVRIKPQELDGNYNYDRYYAWLSSEYMADDLTAIVGSRAFAIDVNRHLGEMGSSVIIPPDNIDGITFGEKLHRILQINISWPDAKQLIDIAGAVVIAMEQDSTKYLDPLGPDGTVIQAIDEPLPPTTVPVPLTTRLNIPVRLVMALVAGLALIFLLDYLDDSVRDRAELETIGIAVLAELPKSK